MVKPLPAQTLKEFLKDRGISQAALAIKLGRSAGLINNIVCGRQAASVNTRADFHRVYPGYDVIEMRMSDEEVAKVKAEKLAPSERTYTESIPVRGHVETPRQKLPEAKAKAKADVKATKAVSVQESQSKVESVFIVTHPQLNPRAFKSKEEATKWISSYVAENPKIFGFTLKQTELL